MEELCLAQFSVGSLGLSLTWDDSGVSYSGGMQLVKNVEIAWKEVEGQKAQLEACLHQTGDLGWVLNLKYLVYHSSTFCQRLKLGFPI